MIFFDRLKFIFLTAFLVGSFGLLTAYILQYVFNFPPCILCTYERIPYILSLIIGFLGWRRPKAFPKTLIVVLFLTFLSGATLSFYHAGIEHGVFPSFGACGGNAQALTAESVKELETLLLATPVVRCDQVYFRLIGLSLTEYNFIFSFLITTFLGFIFWHYQKRKPE
ncbi:MAG: disulfide bond formation protein B [Proteobacteria bacterium]|nr:disulfide bond formation protein B [Pseudomonadota bacterium]